MMTKASYGISEMHSLPNDFHIILPNHLSSPEPAICQLHRSIARLEKIFETLVNSFIENKVGIAENFLSLPLAAHLKDNLVALYAENKLIAAGTGNNTLVTHDKLFRSDVIYWLDRKHDDAYENAFFDLMDSFISYLNSTCYTGITGYEFHYTLYQTGSFYRKHLDQFRNNSSRKYSMIMYLNTDWQLADGGELCIHHEDSTQNISPLNGKSVFFKSSELEHEVLLTNKPRMSITGWLKVN
jgi:SM-20-related protein